MGSPMATARVFKSGNSQAVRLPKEFRLKGPEVEISRRGNEIVLREKPSHRRGLADILDILADMPEDALRDIKDKRPPQKRKGL
jgi:antitoxin VapB